MATSQNAPDEKPESTSRLVVLLALPAASIFFSLLALLLTPFDSDRIGFARGFLMFISGLTGFLGLTTGAIVLIVQLVKSNIHVKNALYFMLAWMLSVLVFIGVGVTQWD
jgi:hypothetical protein